MFKREVLLQLIKVPSRVQEHRRVFIKLKIPSQLQLDFVIAPVVTADFGALHIIDKQTILDVRRTRERPIVRCIIRHFATRSRRTVWLDNHLRRHRRILTICIRRITDDLHNADRGVLIHGW